MYRRPSDTMGDPFGRNLPTAGGGKGDYNPAGPNDLVDPIFYIRPRLKSGKNRPEDAQFQVTTERTEEDAPPFENEAIQYWKCIFDFMYYTLLTPFRFHWDKNTGLYTCVQSRLQRGLQVTLFSFTTVYFLLRVQKMTKLDPEENPSLYFMIVYYFFDTTFLVVLFLGFGRQAKYVTNCFTAIQNHNQRFYSDCRNSGKTKRTTYIICAGCMSTLLMQVLETFLDNGWTWEGFFDYWMTDAAWAFGNDALTNICPFCFGILALTGSLLEKAMNAFSDVLFTMTVLMFHNLVKTFKRDMIRTTNPEMNVPPVEILDHYWWLKHITNEMNLAMDLINGAFIAGNLPFYATNVFEVFNGDANIFMRMRYMFYCSYWYPSLFVGAHANSKLEYVKTWVCKEENYSRIPEAKRAVFLHEIHYHTVGVDSFGIVTVTWHSVGQIISIIMTYALMKSQLKQKEDPILAGAGNDTLGFLNATNLTRSFYF